MLKILSDIITETEGNGVDVPKQCDGLFNRLAQHEEFNNALIGWWKL